MVVLMLDIWEVLLIEAQEIQSIQVMSPERKVHFFKKYDKVSEVTLNLEKYPKGMAFIIVQTSQKTITQKIIIE